MWLVDEKVLMDAQAPVTDDAPSPGTSTTTLDGHAVLVDGLRLRVTDPPGRVHSFLGAFEDVHTAVLLDLHAPDDLGVEGHLVAITNSGRVDVHELGEGRADVVLSRTVGPLRRLDLHDGVLRVNGLVVSAEPFTSGVYTAGVVVADEPFEAPGEYVRVGSRAAEAGDVVALVVAGLRTPVGRGHRTVDELLSLLTTVTAEPRARRSLLTTDLHRLCPDDWLEPVVVDLIRGTWTACPALASTDAVWLSADADVDAGGFVLAGWRHGAAGVELVLGALRDPLGRIDVYWRSAVADGPLKVARVVDAMVVGRNAVWVVVNHDGATTLIVANHEAVHGVAINAVYDDEVQLIRVGGRPAVVVGNLLTGARLWLDGGWVDLPIGTIDVGGLGDALMVNTGNYKMAVVIDNDGWQTNLIAGTDDQELINEPFWHTLPTAEPYAFEYVDGRFERITWVDPGNPLLPADGVRGYLAGEDGRLKRVRVDDGRFVQVPVVDGVGMDYEVAHRPLAVTWRDGQLWAMLSSSVFVQAQPVYATEPERS